MSKDKPPAPIVRITDRGITPVSSYDMEILFSMPSGSEFDLVLRTERSTRQHRTYWKALKTVVNATGRWPTSKHLHRELKLACGYVEKVVDWNTGEVISVPDSIAFNAMTQPDFNEYFKAAMEKLAESVGFDPLMFMEGDA